MSVSTRTAALIKQSSSDMSPEQLETFIEDMRGQRALQGWTTRLDPFTYGMLGVGLNAAVFNPKLNDQLRAAGLREAQQSTGGNVLGSLGSMLASGAGAGTGVLLGGTLGGRVGMIGGGLAGGIGATIAAERARGNNLEERIRAAAAARRQG